MTTFDPSQFAGPGARVHIVGIGGAGMSAIARVLLGRGVAVSGSDRQPGASTDALRNMGAIIHTGHAATHIAGADVLLISSAVRDDNPEVVAARAAGVPVLKRREALPLLLGDRTQIAVAGTHGKTTTTAMIAHILRQTGEDPSYIVGGLMLNTGDNAHAGRGAAFVIEADEYDYMFLGLTPTIAVLTNVEHDHPDLFPDLAAITDAFRQFVARIPEYDGVLIACADDPGAAGLARERRAAGQPTLLYGLDSPGVDWRGMRGESPGAMTVQGMQAGQPVQEAVRLPQVGDHNLRNALAALAAAVAAGVPLPDAAAALESFMGTGRRCEVMGEAGGVTIISDYGHHPTAIRATLQAIRQRYPDASIWAVWQPHTYTRTRILHDGFAHAFADADHVLVTDIYAARERPAPGDPDGGRMAAAIRATGHPDARPSGDLAHTARLLSDALQPGAVLIIFSAGDAPQIGEALLRGVHGA